MSINKPLINTWWVRWCASKLAPILFKQLDLAMVRQINYIRLDLMNHNLDTKVGNSALKKRLSVH